MAAPEGYTKLGNVGYADKGVYSADATYNKYNAVYHEGSTYVALKDNLHGVTPADGVNWRYMAKGFTEASADAITVIDTSGIIDGTKNKKTILQTFLDKVGDFIINKAVTNDALMLKLADYVAKTDIVQVESTATNKVPSSAYLKQVKDSIDSNLEELSENTQAGTKTGISAKGNSVVEYDIMFDKRFPKIPEVVATLHSGTTNPNYGYLAPIVWDVTTTGFKLRIANAYSETFAPDVTWIAVVK
jgi:urocanate hydratase